MTSKRGPGRPRTHSHKISVRLSQANWRLLERVPNVSETVNRAVAAYFNQEGSQRPPRQ